MGRILLYLFVLGLFLVGSGCGNSGSEIRPEIQALPIKLTLNRFDQEFDRLEDHKLELLKDKYPYLFPTQYPDSIWIAKHRDTLQQRLRSEVNDVFRDFEPYRADLELFYKHVAYYFPGAKIPTVITLTNDVDVDNRVVLADSLLFIGLDNYLGPQHEFYQGFSRYIAKDLNPDYIVSDVAESFAISIIPYPKERSFMSRMVYFGKILYLKDMLLPQISDSLKIRYTARELGWAKANEGQIWRYFVERELLYSTDQQLNPSFLDPAPFSKFRLELDNESPGRIGRYIGWQIVRAYMSNHSDSPENMISLKGDELFRLSGYKPPK